MKRKTSPRPTLRCTKDYSMFEVHPYNRDIRSTRELEKSMRTFGFDEGFPIRCFRNGSKSKLKVTHGHHRLHVARKLGISVWFIVARNDIPLFASEASNHQWNVKDFTDARARAGEVPAQAVIAFGEDTGIPLSCSLSLVGGHGASSGKKSRAMKKGTFATGDMQHANAVGSIVKHCRDNGVEFASNSFFVKAVSKALLVDQFDADVFMHKVRTNPGLMVKRRGIEGYLDLVEMVYNNRSKNKIPLAFLASEASRARSVVNQ